MAPRLEVLRRSLLTRPATPGPADSALRGNAEEGIPLITAVCDPEHSWRWTRAHTTPVSDWVLIGWNNTAFFVSMRLSPHTRLAQHDEGAVSFLVIRREVFFSYHKFCPPPPSHHTI